MEAVYGEKPRRGRVVMKMASRNHGMFSCGMGRGTFGPSIDGIGLRRALPAGMRGTP